MNRVAGERLEFALAHWEERWQRRTTIYDSPAKLLDAAGKIGQDFVCVGKVYRFPQQADFLTSPDFGEEALAILEQAFPLYKFAFEKTEGA